MASATIGALRVSLAADTAAFGTGLKQAQTRLAAFETSSVKSLNNVGAGFASMQRSVGASLGLIKTTLAGLGVFAAIDAIVKLHGKIDEVVRSAADISDVATLLGTTTKSLQGLQFATSKFHFSAEETNAALVKFSRNLGLAAQGSGELHEILAANHVAISGDFQTDFLRFADLIKNASSEEQKNLLIMAGFGRGAAEMGELFEGGADGIRAAVEQAAAWGAVIDDQNLQKIEELDKAWAAIGQTIGVTVKNAIVSVVLAFTDVQNAVMGAIGQIGKVPAALDALAKDINKTAPGAAPLNATGLPSVIPRRGSPTSTASFPANDPIVAAAIAAAAPSIDQFVAEKAAAAKRLAESLGGTAATSLGTLVPRIAGFGGVTAGADPAAAAAAKAAADRAESEREAAAQRLQSLMDSLLSETEAEQNAYAQRMADLADFQNQKLVSTEDATALAAQIEEDHRQKMIALDKVAAQKRLAIFTGYSDSLAGVLEGIGAVIGTESEKSFKINKALSVATAVIKGIEAVTSSYAAGAAIGGPPLGLAFAAAAAATTAGQIAALRRQTFSGAASGGGAPVVGGDGGAGGAAGAPATAPAGGTLYLQINGQQFGREQVRALAEQLIDFQRDGGRVVLA